MKDFKEFKKIDQFILAKKAEVADSLCYCEVQGLYLIHNVPEKKPCCHCCCGHRSLFTKVVQNESMDLILTFNHPKVCNCCCKQTLQVQSAGTLLGVVKEESSLFRPRFTIRDPTGDIVLQITGPCCLSVCCVCCCGHFKVLTADGKDVIGKVAKGWTHLDRPVSSKESYLGITFPRELDVKMKAVLLGAAIMIDFVYYNRSLAHIPVYAVAAVSEED